MDLLFRWIAFILFIVGIFVIGYATGCAVTKNWITRHYVMYVVGTFMIFAAITMGQIIDDPR